MAGKSTRTPVPPRPADDRIVIRGARVHNLKNINLELPRNALVVITGVSGSGKSSLAFDTLYAEGQRRYVESLSSYARQFLERMDKPDVDLIQGMSPALAIEQKTSTRNPRSTVGTSTEVYDYLRLLYARAGRTFCYNCGKQVTRDSVQTVLTALNERLGVSGADSLKAYLTFPLPVHQGESTKDALVHLKKEGFFRVIAAGQVIDLNADTVPAKVPHGDLHVLVDRVVFRSGEDNPRLADSIETAFTSGNGSATVILPDTGERLQFNREFVCATCGIAYQEPDPQLFSFNSPFGACPACQGFGRAVGIDMNLVVPVPAKAIRDGAIAPWSTPKFRPYLEKLMRFAPGLKIRTDVPFGELTGEERKRVIGGSGEYAGIDGFFRMVEKKSYKIYYRVLLSRYRGYTTCPACNGARLRNEALSVRVGGRTIAEVSAMTIARAAEFMTSLDLTPYEQEIAKRILVELGKRIAYLNDVGIGYLTLDRLSNTLSGGESQRINLATSLGSSLVGALYVLDEPSIGLHPRDNGRLIRLLKALRDAGNSVIVVEHDADMMKASDFIVDMGPRAGEHGGEIVYAGPASSILSAPGSLTAGYLSGALSIPVPLQRRTGKGPAITVEGASANNLRDVSVRFPLNRLVCVTGVSGSGKSTLVHEVLYAGLKRLKGEPVETVGAVKNITGHELISTVELVDQSPIGRSPRSNPITYVQVFDQIRNLFAGVQASRIHGFKPGHFSFNVPGGRCESCEGDGVVKVEMQFLADLYLLCDACKGKRYRPEVLQVMYRGKNIDDVLNMSVTEAIRFFGAEVSGRRIVQKLNVLRDVGLGYIRLGQSATTLSGGEAQRVKLAAHLNASDDGRHTLFILDEPTTGLHFDDIARLLGCFNALIEAGNSVILIEHNLDVIKCADCVIDLGPEAGDEGGRVVAEGTPEEVSRVAASHTGRFLKKYLMK